MLRRLRTFITFLVLVSLSVVSLSAAAVVYLYRLPDPETADGEGLFRWLITRDVRYESPETQQKLLRRLERELRGGVDDMDRVKENLDPAREAQLRKNVEFLGSLWFREKAADFALLAEGERDQFVDEQVAQLQNLGAVYQTLAGSGAPQKKSLFSDLSLMVSLMQKVNNWINAAEPDEQEQMRQLVYAVQKRVATRKFNLGLMGV